MKTKTQLARKLRRHQTDCEQVLWRAIRNRQLCGHKFRRQVPIDRFIVDFVCQEKRLIIELDGGQHTTTPEADADRTRVLEGCGYIVLRFWNADILGNLQGVLETIAEQLQRV